jgi:hypothetical protein
MSTVKTTKAALVAWLAQFPDEAVIEVIVAEERRGYWESYMDASERDLVLEPLPAEMYGYFSGQTFEVEGKFDHDTDKTTIHTIRFGKKN